LTGGRTTDIIFLASFLDRFKGGACPLMWVWLLGGYAVLMLALIACAGFVALFVADEKRRKTAYDVLRLALTTATGSAGVVAVALKLHEAGLL
jgi:hypothetical protein